MHGHRILAQLMPYLPASPRKHLNAFVSVIIPLLLLHPPPLPPLHFLFLSLDIYLNIHIHVHTLL